MAGNCRPSVLQAEKIQGLMMQQFDNAHLPQLLQCSAQTILVMTSASAMKGAAGAPPAQSAKQYNNALLPAVMMAGGPEDFSCYIKQPLIPGSADSEQTCQHARYRACIMLQLFG